MTVKTKFQTKTKNIPNRISIRDIKALKKGMQSSFIYNVLKKLSLQVWESGFIEFSIKRKPVDIACNGCYFKFVIK